MEARAARRTRMLVAGSFLAGMVALVCLLRFGREIERDGPRRQAALTEHPARERAVPREPEIPPGISEAKREPVVAVQAPASRRGRDQDTKRSGPLTIAGRVVDDTGEPLPRFSIDAEKRPSARKKEVRLSREDRAMKRSFEGPDGLFFLDVAAAGQWELTAHADGERRSALAIVEVPDQSQGFVLVVPRAGSISGSVVGGAAALAGAEVHLIYAGDDEPDFAFGSAPEPDARCEATGGFRLDGLLPGAVRIMARHPEWCDSEWIDLLVAPGVEHGGLSIELTRGGRIEGSVDPALGDVADREIGLFSFRGGMGWRDARTDPSGRFVIEHVMPQDYVIELMQRDAAPETSLEIRRNISVKEGATTMVVLGGRPILARGSVSLKGEPVPNVPVTTNMSAIATTDVDGRFELALAGAGEYSFNVGFVGGSRAWFERTVPDQDVVELSFEVPGGALIGRVIGARGPVPITAERSGSTDARSFHRDHFRSMVTEPDGSFEFRMLAPGTYTLRTPDDSLSYRPPARLKPCGRVVLSGLEVGAVEIAGIEIQLPPGGRISGRVVQAGNIPVLGGWVSVLDERGRSLSARRDTQTDATGHFVVSNVAAGTYMVRVSVGELEFTSAPVLVEVGEVAETLIEIR